MPEYDPVHSSPSPAPPRRGKKTKEKKFSTCNNMIIILFIKLQTFIILLKSKCPSLTYLWASYPVSNLRGPMNIVDEPKMNCMCA